MKPLVIIPARGGSKGIPNKNIKLLRGKPLIEYTVNAAMEVFPEDQICVSTDSKEIKNLVESLGLGVPFLRPSSLATDTSGTYEVLLHAIDHYESAGYFPDTIILLQPTSPFRTSQHIRYAVEQFSDECEMLVSVKRAGSNPYYLYRRENTDGWLEAISSQDYSRRQDCPVVYELNGAIYITRSDTLKVKPLSKMEKVLKYEMDERSSHDIDTQFDWEVAETILETHPTIVNS